MEWTNRFTPVLCRSVNTDEMCNFYIMYWTAAPEPLELKYCFSLGPPLYRWKDQFNTLPWDASILPADSLRPSMHQHRHF